jgi:hypothetical protein
MSPAGGRPSPSRTSKPPLPLGPSRAELTAWAEAHDVPLIFLDPPAYFDHAIIGLLEGFGQEPAVLYDTAVVLAALARDLGDLEAAEEWFEFNTVGAYLGPATPRFLFRPPR